MKTAIYILAFLSLSIVGYGQALPYNPPQMAAYWNPTGAAWEPLTSTGGGQALSTNPPPLALYCLDGSGKWVPMDGTCIGGGDTTDGTVTDFTAGTLSPLFTTSVATSTTTPALTFVISNAAQNSVLAGPASGGAGAYSFQTAPAFSAANLTNFPATLVDTTSTQTLTNKTVDGVTPTTFGFLDATSSIQTQLNGKQTAGTYVTAVSCVTAAGVSCTSSGGATPALTFSLGAITPTSTNGVSAATMAFMDATSSVQTQLNAKQANLGFTPAHSGANSDITSLSGLTTPLSVAQGGTGTASPLTGIVRGGSPLTAAEISGDCTTSGSNAITCTKSNGTALGALATAGAGTGVSIGGGNLNSNAVYQLSFQPGLLTSVTNTIAVFSKVSKASTVDNITGSAFLLSCISNPTVTMYECGTSATCVSPTAIGSVTVTAAGTATAGTVSSASITAGDWVGFAITAGTCTSLDIATNAQVHSN